MPVLWRVYFFTGLSKPRGQGGPCTTPVFSRLTQFQPGGTYTHRLSRIFRSSYGPDEIICHWHLNSRQLPLGTWLYNIDIVQLHITTLYCHKFHLINWKLRSTLTKVLNLEFFPSQNSCTWVGWQKMVRSVNCELNSGLDSFESIKLPNLFFVRDWVMNFLWYLFGNLLLIARHDKAVLKVERHSRGKPW